MAVTQATGAGQLPVETDEFVGRTAELRQIDALLHDARLVTLVGPGGVGKTRIVLRAADAAARRYPDGVCLVELSALRDPELLPHTIARRLGLAEQAPASQLDALLAHLARPPPAADPRHLRAPHRRGRGAGRGDPRPRRRR